ncbi:nitroreductase [Marinobacterium mangrovicola]|uniref:Nitroreductase n=1 Tax=Marinobacterium mangrovicola TaxID=1476959 RepID=A0A4R1G8P4_9GAMM|nr:nitroreductase [Marinobacterium mangrovicola]TCK04234.1 nitroreductase [Marinobacterium mangrovicola]
MSTPSFHDIVRQRRAVRKYLPTPLTSDQLNEVLEDAQWSPSNCNMQPWQVHLVSGATKDKLSEALKAEHLAGRTSEDFWFDHEGYEGVYLERMMHMGQKRNEALNIARDDHARRDREMLRQFEFFDAPHVALLFMPVFGDSVRTAGDLGMYGQTLLLSLTAHGYAGIPQTLLGMHAGVIREVLGIPEEMKMLYGISFGYADPEATGYSVNLGRAPISDNVRFYD